MEENRSAQTAPAPTQAGHLSPERLLELLSRAAKLKTTPRHCFTAPGRKESVADHSWRIALMAMLLRGTEEFRGLDLDKVVRMCLIHDLGEAFTGDIPSFEKTEADVQREDGLFQEWVDSFPVSLREEWHALLREMDERQTPEARIYKALDQTEAVISHNESEISTWLPLEYELQRTYGWEGVRFSPFLTALREQVDDWTARKIEERK